MMRIPCYTERTLARKKNDLKWEKKEFMWENLETKYKEIAGAFIGELKTKIAAPEMHILSA